jgi:NAD(P)-dependent dehydrogenase (short-subunit alcohol dehydrogenase family)
MTTTNSEPMRGMNILISGGTQGLGEAVARECAAQGASGLVLAGRSADRGNALAAELSAAGTPTLFVEADVSAPDAPTGIMGAATARFGVIHGLANVAASTARGNVFNTTVAEWDDMMAINVRAPFQLLQAVATQLKDTGEKGSIVNVGSISGYGGQPFLIGYCVSKGALNTLTKNAAFSLMRHGVRVNQVNPGWMDTESEAAIQKKWHNAPDDWLVAAEASQPTGRLVKPDEVARTIAFLLSPASGLITGTLIDVDQSVQGAGDAPKPSIEETPK